MAGRSDQAASADQVEGRNPVIEVLRGPREVYEIYLAKVADRSHEVEEIISLAASAGVPVKDASKNRIDAMARTRAPQGVIAKVEPFRFLDLGETLERVAGSPDPLVLALDGIEDPQNLGAVIRVAETSGVDVILMPRKRSVGVTAVVAKASAGAIEHVAIAHVSSLPAALERLKAQGLFIAGADADGDTLYTEADMTGPLAIVLGSEGRGLARLVREKCDAIVSLPMAGRVTSLNVATTGAVLLFEAVRQRTACPINPR